MEKRKEKEKEGGTHGVVDVGGDDKLDNFSGIVGLALNLRLVMIT